MITSKQELREHLEADAKALGYKKNRFFCFGKEVLKFEHAMRKLEYYHYLATTSKSRGKALAARIPYYFWRFAYHDLSVKCGFDISIGTFGKGLNIHHRGTIAVNKHARIGEYCDLLPGVVIGQNGTSDDVPTIGNHVYIGTGAKVIGKIVIADHIAIGANAVVNKSFLKEGIAVAGVPAKEVGRRKELR